MLQANSIALLTVSLNFAAFVPLFTNLRLRLDGAENHRSHHWSGQGTSLSQFSASKMSFSLKRLRDPLMLAQQDLSYRTHTSHDDPQHLPQIQRRTSTPITQHGFGVDPHARSEFGPHPSTLSITVIAKENVAFGTASGARAYGGVFPLRPFFYQKCDPSRTCATLIISSSRHSHLCLDNAMSCHSNFPSNLSFLFMFRLS